MVHNYFVSIIDNNNTNLIGAKGKNLHILSEGGFNVPLTFCIITKAYEHFINNSNLQKTIHQAIQNSQLTSKNKSQQIINAIEQADIPQEIISELMRNDLLINPNLKWAIRSSSNLEDLADTSFAGLYDTYLNVEDLDNILDAVKKCWASLWTERAIVYREKNNFNHAQATMAVIVQEMVNSQYAGVIFTKKPSSENQDEMLLEYCEGLGERLVSGEITPYSCTIDRSSLTIHHWKVPDIRKFADDEIRRLSTLALKVEKHFACLQDIEWAFDGETIYVLQTRAISNQVQFEPIPSDGVWTRANIGEVLPNVITPLTWDVFRATLMNCPDLALKPSEDIQNSDDGVKRIHGRGYICLNHFLDSFCYLPFVTPKIMSRVLGVNLPPRAQSYNRPSGPLVRLAQIVFILNALGILPRLKLMVKQLPHLPHKELSRIEEIINWNARCFHLHLKCTAYAIGAFGLLAHFLDRWVPSEAEALLPVILVGHENLQTAAQGISLWDLAARARKNPKLRDILGNDLDWSVTAQHMAHVEGGPQFLTIFQAFLDANGARASGEFELAVPRWREDPSFVLNVLRKYLETQETTPNTGGSTIRRHHRQEAISHIKASLGPLQRWVFTRLLASYGVYTTLRENIKYRLMEGYALLRQIFLKMGTDLVDTGVLDNAGDVFFLTPSEVLALMKEGEFTRQTTELILERKTQHAHWQSQDAPDLIVESGQEVVSLQGNELIGIGCSPGTAEGIARVLFNTSEAHTLTPGEILIAPHIDPGWTPLFLSCKAVVTEIGGFLSHGATVAREYGIPAVVNVKGLTEQIRTGDVIRVNGTNGLVTIVDRIDIRS